jgi:hypothetical protein
MKLPSFLSRPAGGWDTSTWGDEGDDVTAELTSCAQSLLPDAAVLSRLGTTVRAAFIASTPIAGSSDAAAHGRLGWSWSRPRALAAMAAVAILTLSTVSFAAAESGPGQPFYRLRLGIESVNLPPAGSENRLAADLDRADARLADIAGRASTHDWSGAADAAGAYRDVIATIALPADEPARGVAERRLDAQLTRLESLRASAQGPETAALDRAIAVLAGILGIPVPVVAATPAPASSGPPPERDAAAGSAKPGATGDAPDAGGRDGRDSVKPGASPSPTGRDGFGGDGDRGGSGGVGGSGGFGGSGDTGGFGGSGDTGGNHATPSPTPGGPDGGRADQSGHWRGGR